MIFKLKNALFAFFMILVTWVGWTTYTYFFDTTLPELRLNGLEHDNYYCGDVQCLVASNKSGSISIWLDNQPLISNYKISAGEHEQPFIVPTKTIANGKHALRAEFCDRTYKKNKVVIDRMFSVDNMPLQAAFVKSEADNKVFQGRTLHLQFQVNKEIKDAKVRALSNSFACFPESAGSLVYESYIPMTCEENPNEYLFTVEITDRVGNTLNLDNKFQVVPFPFKKQVVTINADKLSEEHEIAGEESEAKFNAMVAELTKNSPQEKLWRGAFCTPIDVSKITCDFGTVRSTQHKGRYAHKALDVINLPKSTVWSTQDGIVAYIGRWEAGGNTVIVDHGWGVLSMFYHLDNFASNIKVGDKIAMGNPVGTIGKTGYATGYHLHWEQRVNNIPVDPMQWTKQTF